MVVRASTGAWPYPPGAWIATGRPADLPSPPVEPPPHPGPWPRRPRGFSADPARNAQPEGLPPRTTPGASAATPEPPLRHDALRRTAGPYRCVPSSHGAGGAGAGRRPPSPSRPRPPPTTAQSRGARFFPERSDAGARSAERRPRKFIPSTFTRMIRWAELNPQACRGGFRSGRSAAGPSGNGTGRLKGANRHEHDERTGKTPPERDPGHRTAEASQLQTPYGRPHPNDSEVHLCDEYASPQRRQHRDHPITPPCRDVPLALAFVDGLPQGIRTKPPR
jgi:hypothetical protein